MKPIPNKKKIVDYYQKQVEEHGFGAKGMDWKNEETQDLRFEIINRYIDFFDKPSVLDVGCGGGGYLGYCKKKELDFIYKGIDIVPDMIDQVNSIYGNDKAKLINVENVSENFDYVIASGTYNAKLDSKTNDWEIYVFESIENMFKISNKKVILNLMTPHVDYEYDRLYYPDLGKLTSFIVKKMTRNFIIDHSYDLYELTLVIHK
ncbi:MULTISPECIES: methyltransferase domain-containing protein [Aquimarina]|uniref:methyltransferase domain-containing protein n=2 Tax=Flavobacteriaceae TaxID=49546 RepID=UPI000945AA57|nr:MULTISPECIES: methyltransferase domain-containing protein [Aquimarina]